MKPNNFKEGEVIFVKSFVWSNSIANVGFKILRVMDNQLLGQFVRIYKENSRIEQGAGFLDINSIKDWNYITETQFESLKVL